MKTKMLFALFWGLSCCAAKQASAQNLVKNGNFSIQPVTEWVPVAPATVIEAWATETTYGGTNAGNNVAEVDPQANLRQTNIPVIAGQKYYFSYLRSRRTGNGAASNPNNINVKIYNGTTAPFLSRNDASTNATFQWTCIVDSFVPTTNTVDIDFTNLATVSTGLGTIVDRITIAAEKQPVTVTGVICQGNNFTLDLPPQDANTQYSNISWTGPNGFTATTASISFTNAQPAQSGVYNCTMQLNNTCMTVTATYILTISPNKFNISRSICAGEAYDFYGRALYQSGTYDTVIPNPGSCDSLIILTLTNNPLPNTTLNETGELHICAGDAQRLSGVLVPGYTYQWFKDGSAIPGANKDTLMANTSGVYTLRVVTNKGCADTSEPVKLFVEPKPTVKISFVGDNDFCAQDTVQLRASATGTNLEYYWTPDTYFRPTTTNQYRDVRAVIPESGYITVRVYDNNMCAAEDSVYIKVHPCCEIGMPNAFTPNGDGRNDYFKPIMQVGQTLVSLKIYNRLGQLVYEGDGATSKGWDGTFKEKPAASGVYMYHITYNCSDKQNYREKGDLVLIR